MLSQFPRQVKAVPAPPRQFLSAVLILLASILTVYGIIEHNALALWVAFSGHLFGHLGRIHLSHLTTSLAVAALASALSAGLDFLFVLQAGQLLPIENAAPLDFWGLMMIGGVVCAGAGWVCRYWPGVILAHMLLAGIYCARGLSALVWMAINLKVTGQWYGSSWITGVSWVVLQSVVHLVLAEAARRQWDKRQLST